MKSLLTGYSKKLVAFIVFVGVVMLNKWLDIGLTEPDIYAIAGMGSFYTVSQGLSDFGKEGAKIHVNGSNKH